MSEVTQSLSNTILPTTEAFFKPEHARLNQVLLSLVQRNQALGGHQYGFRHNGQLFSPAGPAKLRGHKIERAYPEIQEEAEDHLVKKAKLKYDILRLNQSMIVIASRCSCVQDFRDSLPEPLVACSPFVQLPRHQEEGAVLRNYPVLQAQFEKVVRIVLYYSANRLIF